jgi:hypothetical protein
MSVVQSVPGTALAFSAAAVPQSSNTVVVVVMVKEGVLSAANHLAAMTTISNPFVVT